MILCSVVATRRKTLVSRSDVRRALALASQSPRRRQLLEQLGAEMGFQVVVMAPGPGEDAEALETVLGGEDPLDYVQRVTRLKAEAGWQRMRGWAADGPIIPVMVSDTTVALGDRILGKPGSVDEAKAMLRLLSGQVHQVHTAVGLAVPTGAGADVCRSDGGSDLAFDYAQVVSSSDVKFGELTDDWIDWVVSTGEPMDKAGAYAIQGHAASVIEWVKGSPSGVMGLPLFETRQLLMGLFNSTSGYSGRSFSS
jgi:septum formation protein